MTVLTRWNPVRDLAGAEIDRLNRMFENVFNGEPLSGSWVPLVDIYETAEQDVVIQAELPGFKRDAIKVTFEHNVLTIEGERQLDGAVPRERYHRLERNYG